jgi:hypothetical protein
MDIYDRLASSGTPVRIDPAELARGIAPGTPFPPSYTEFVSRFGYGLLCDRFLVYPPMGDYPDSFSQQSPGIRDALLQTLHLDDRDYDFQLAPDGSPELVQRLVGFATGENGESLFWDLRPGGPAEAPIYVTGSGLGLRFGGHDLRDLITRLTHPAHFKSILRFSSEPLPLIFRAASSPALKAWLARRQSDA